MQPVVVFVVHDVAHALPAHARLFWHATIVAPSEQLPLPSHWVSFVSMPPEQPTGLVHPGVPAGHCSHTPPAAHLPSFLHVDAACAVHWPLGSDAPAMTVPHVPLVPPVSAAEHAWHLPLHALLQQNPLTQLPIWHWLLVEHAVPFENFIVQTLLPQK
jgi:hypothetical protein